MTKQELLEKLSSLNDQLVKVNFELKKILDTKRELKETFIAEHSKYQVDERFNETFKIYDIMFNEFEEDLEYYLEYSNGDYIGGFSEEELNENFTK